MGGYKLKAGGNRMAKVRILLIGYKKIRSEQFIAALRKRYDVSVASSGTKGMPLAENFFPHVIVLDALSMRTSGERLCRKLRAKLPRTPIIHIHSGPVKNVKCPADVILIPPFTSRKLINNIERLLQASDDEMVTCGPFMVNVVRRTLVSYGNETQLTPKQALLVETFLRRPGETLERRKLMEIVWDTNYLGDTRTLDVHIRWVRRAMEAGGKPRYLRTVRGVGYQLEIPNLNGSK